MMRIVVIDRADTNTTLAPYGFRVGPVSSSLGWPACSAARPAGHQGFPQAKRKSSTIVLPSMQPRSRSLASNSRPSSRIFVQLYLLTHPVSRARNILGHRHPPSEVGDLHYGLESVRKHQAGLQSFRSMRRIEARRRNASALRLRFSQSLASLRQRLSQAKVRSTTQRRGSTTNPLVRSERLTISVSS